MKKCEICGKEVNGINIVQIEEHETVQICDGCYSPDLGEIVNKIEE
jgi:ribosome-binding protein aMBF1 (putative translation factor)